MKTISKLFIALLLTVAGISSANAQSDYLLDYGPGSLSWDIQMQQRINEMSMQNAMMQAQIVNFYRQQADAATLWLQTNPYESMPGVLTYDGVYLTPETVNDYHKEQVECDHCDGGYNYRTVYMGRGESHQVKSRCSWCHGTGYLTKTVRNE